MVFGRGGFISGRPVPCATCRTPFTPSSVASKKRNTPGLRCPRCCASDKALKAQKKAKKRESGS